VPSTSSVIVIVGPSGAGKSTLCGRLIHEAARRGIGVGGVVARTRLCDGLVDGLDVVNVATGERRPLAEFDRPTGGPVTGRWHFHEAAFADGLNWCRQVPPGALFVVDEIGPLELVQQRGWAPLVPVLAAHAGPVVVVVRPAFAEALIALLGGRTDIRIDVTPETRDRAAGRALAVLEPGA
jgi:nucleoside-triphosphatase THEP1